MDDSCMECHLIDASDFHGRMHTIERISTFPRLRLLCACGEAAPSIELFRDHAKTSQRNDAIEGRRFRWYDGDDSGRSCERIFASAHDEAMRHLPRGILRDRIVCLCGLEFTDRGKYIRHADHAADRGAAEETRRVHRIHEDERKQRLAESRADRVRREIQRTRRERAQEIAQASYEAEARSVLASPHDLYEPNDLYDHEPFPF